MRITPFGPTLRSASRHGARETQADSSFALPLGGTVLLIALCTPIAMLLLLFGMDAYEGLLAPPPPEPDEAEKP